MKPKRLNVKGTAFGKPEKNGSRKWAGPESGSVLQKIQTGDKEFLKTLGMTHKEAKEAYNEWLKGLRINSAAMERWYRGVASSMGKANQHDG